MKKALISPMEKVNIIAEWTVTDNIAYPTFQTVENGVRIAGTDDNEYDVAPPLFWKECDSEVDEHTWYYNIVEERFVEMNNAVNPLFPKSPSGSIPKVTL